MINLEPEYIEFIKQTVASRNISCISLAQELRARQGNIPI